MSNNKNLEINKKTNSYFSEQYLFWLYDPICKLLNYEKNTPQIIHYFINIY